MEHAPFFVAGFAALFVLALASCKRTEHMHASSQLPSLLANNGREACLWAAWFALLHEALVSSNLSHSAAGKKQAESSRQHIKVLLWNTHRFLLLALPRFLFLRLRPAKEQNTCMHPRSCRRFWRTTAARHVFGPHGLPYCTKPW